MRGDTSRGFAKRALEDPFYQQRQAQADADAAKDLGQPTAGTLQDQADALREDIESKGE